MQLIDIRGLNVILTNCAEGRGWIFSQKKKPFLPALQQYACLIQYYWSRIVITEAVRPK